MSNVKRSEWIRNYIIDQTGLRTPLDYYSLRLDLVLRADSTTGRRADT
jgi:hypothetical protein